MKNVLAIAIAFAATSAFALDLPASVDLVQSGVATFNSDLTPGPAVDVYHVTVSNPNASDATAFNMSLTSAGLFVNNNPGGLTFSQTGTDLPAIATFTFGESFFVLPAGQILSVGDVDTASELATDVTLAGTTALIPGSGSAVVAVLSVPAGTQLDQSGFSGNAAVDGAFSAITFGEVIPEPSTALLAGLALVGFVARRK